MAVLYLYQKNNLTVKSELKKEFENRLLNI